MGLIGAGLSAAGAIYGGIAASKSARKALQEAARRQEANQNWYDRQYNADATQRADAMRILQGTEDAIKRRNEAVAGQSAVMGGTGAAEAASKEASAQGMANAVSAVVANNEARKDKVDAMYTEKRDEIQQQMAAAKQQQANAIGQAVQGVAGAAGQMDFGELKVGKKNDQGVRTKSLKM